MKRLRVLLVCLIVALLCWYPSQDVYCSEQSSAGPAQPAGDGTHGSQEQEQEPDSTQHKVLEEWPAQTSYDVGLEAERAALEKQETQDTHQEQTVNPQVAETTETKPDRESDSEPTVPEPVDPQADSQFHKQDAPVLSTSESLPAQDQVSGHEPPPAELFGDAPEAQPRPELQSAAAASPHEVKTAPTSGTDGHAHTGPAQVATAAGELPLDNFVCDEHSDSECGLMPPKLATCENPPFGSPLLSVDEAVLEDQQSNQSQSAGPETGVPPTQGHEERPDVPLQVVLADLEPEEDKTLQVSRC
ncbi:uncharacterized protein LOC142897160 isoform X1 [Nelusetta ayraudi]|uniref:uncharacterized protein LOC142897160 isoform X1 n=1 Tax=Nelusetta ayraudi TaxID=303726 RepID=UPI003F72F86A